MMKLIVLGMFCGDRYSKVEGGCTSLQLRKSLQPLSLYSLITQQRTHTLQH